MDGGSTDCCSIFVVFFFLFLNSEEADSDFGRSPDVTDILAFALRCASQYLDL